MPDVTFPWPAVVREPLDETRQVEYKAGISWEQIRPKIFRAALAMSNTEDGGYVVVGVPEQNGTWKAEGIDELEWRTYPKLQTFADELSSVGCPPIDVRVEEKLDDGKRFLFVTIRASTSGPVICTRNCKPEEKGVRKSSVYYRTISKQSRSADPVDWQEMLARHGKDEYAKGYARGEKSSGKAVSDATKFKEELEDF